MIVDREALRHPLLPLGRVRLRLLMEQILGRLGLHEDCLELRITTDRVMTRLFARHLGGAGPTNVLAFPIDRADGSRLKTAFLGTIALNADAVIREAFLYQQVPMDHFIRLLTHAVLHLAGFEHGEIMDDLTESAVEWCRRQPAGRI